MKALTAGAYGAVGLCFVVDLGAVILGIWPEGLLTFRIEIALLLVACVLNAVEVFGLKSAVLFLSFSSIVGWIAEQLGTSQGIGFPQYHYGNQFGAMLGGVPLIIPPGWLIFSYPAFRLSRGIFRSHSVWLQAFAGAVVMACLDLAIEPLALLRKYWIWADDTHFVATMITVFCGWLLWGVVSQLGMNLAAGPSDRQAGLTLPVLVIAAIALYATWITAREWSLLFAVVTLASLGPIIIAATAGALRSHDCP